MAIVRRNNVFPSVPALFNDLFTKDLWNWAQENNSSTNTTIPAVNLKENNEAFEVEVAVPGMNKEDFRVELNGNMLTISSEKQIEDAEKENDRYTRREFSYQSFQRSFQLPADVVDADNIKARYENGLLQLSIPKKDHAKKRPPRTIEIS